MQAIEYPYGASHIKGANNIEGCGPKGCTSPPSGTQRGAPLHRRPPEYASVWPFTSSAIAGIRTRRVHAHTTYSAGQIYRNYSQPCWGRCWFDLAYIRPLLVEKLHVWPSLTAQRPGGHPSCIGTSKVFYVLCTTLWRYFLVCAASIILSLSLLLFQQLRAAVGKNSSP